MMTNSETRETAPMRRMLRAMRKKAFFPEVQKLVPFTACIYIYIWVDVDGWLDGWMNE